MDLPETKVYKKNFLIKHEFIDEIADNLNITFCSVKHLQADRNADESSDNKSLLLSPIVQDYLVWHQFGKTSPERDVESLRTIEEYRNLFKSRYIDSINLSLLIDSYVKRKFINLSKDGLKGTNQLQCECKYVLHSWRTFSSNFI